MKKVILSLILLSLLSLGLYAEVSTAQTPPIQVAFTCNQTGPKCAEFLRLVSDGLGWTAENGLTRLVRLAIQQKKGEDAKTAINAAEAAVQADFPEQP